MRRQQIKKLLKIMIKNASNDCFSENFWNGANVVCRCKETLGLTKKGLLNTEYPISLFDDASFKEWKEGK